MVCLSVKTFRRTTQAKAPLLFPEKTAYMEELERTTQLEQKAPSLLETVEQSDMSDERSTEAYYDLRGVANQLRGTYPYLPEHIRTRCFGKARRLIEGG